jgi:hypothetical protein
MPTLILSTWRLPAAEALAGAARRLGWRAFGLDRTPAARIDAPTVYYGGSDVADQVAERFDLALLEPPFDLLARTPYALRLRSVEFTHYNQLRPFDSPTFVKPADVRRRAFDAGLYTDVRAARLEAPLDPGMPVLLSEPVEWLEEHRCFILDGRLVASSPYLQFGRPSWSRFNARDGAAPLPEGAREVCGRLLSTTDIPLPPAFVVDVGLVRDRGWAVVEYNPAWCSSLLGGDPVAVLPVLERASRTRRAVGASDRRWVMRGAVLPAVRPVDPPWRAHAGAMT